MNRNLFLGYVAIAIGIGLIELSQDYYEYLGFRLLVQISFIYIIDPSLSKSFKYPYVNELVA